MPNQAEIARINGAKSNGPVTEQGKIASSRNAGKHGLTSTRIVLPHESQDEYDRLEQAFLNTYRPANPVESDLVREMVASRWRLRRVEQMETAVLKKALHTRLEEEGIHPDEAAAFAFADVAESKTLRTVTRHAAQLRRAYEKAGRELTLLQENRQAENLQADDERIQAELIEAELENTELQNEPGAAEADEATERFVEEYLRPPAEFRGYIAQQLATFTDNPIREAA